MVAVHGISLSTAREGDHVVICARGELDFVSLPQFEGTVDAVLDDAANTCVVDCKGVTFIDSESLKCFIGLYNRMADRGKVFYLRNCSVQVKRALSLIGLQEMFAAPSQS